ncbi:MAG TPA: endonuclease/exonuclease/phosphatase family protein [Anaerolineales bacterium]|nr:endonuclease/exonuclease/phosphatase family protein [Anaerolineales bacterium]
MSNNNVSTFRVVTWNIGGAKFFNLPVKSIEGSPYTREDFRRDLHEALNSLTHHFQPDVVLLQEIVRFGNTPKDLIDIERIPGYYYAPTIAIDTVNQSHPLKWTKYYDDSQWEKGTYLAQGYGLLWRQTLTHAATWDFAGQTGPDIEKEIVRIETGLFTGSRDTEPRIAVIAHFIIDFQGRPLDIFIINLHLTTLKGEREGSPNKDIAASQVRQQQLEIVTHGVVSRYNEWVAEKRKQSKRLPAIWVLGGDFNCMPSAPEIKALEGANFIDLNPAKGTGTKGTTVPIEKATITLDYLFAGPAYYSIDPYLAMQAIRANPLPLAQYRVSDHFPILADVPIIPPHER